MIDVGTKKGQVRKTARRAYAPKKPKRKTTRQQVKIMLWGSGYYNKTPKLFKDAVNLRKMK
tara:strand:+ start:759 stop:941 length:183 start_codon:yes stop_codon:yes gene_type:complete